jgi:hypothetical protein
MDALQFDQPQAIDITYVHSVPMPQQDLATLRAKALEIQERQRDHDTSEKDFQVLVEQQIQILLDEQEGIILSERVRSDGQNYRLDQQRLSLVLGKKVGKQVFVNNGSAKDGEFNRFHYVYDNKMAHIHNDILWQQVESTRFMGWPGNVKKLLTDTLFTKEDGVLVLNTEAYESFKTTGSFSNLKMTVNEVQLNNNLVDEIEFSVTGTEFVLSRIYVDKNNYARVLKTENYDIPSFKLRSINEYSDFGQDNFPRTINTSTYDNQGNVISGSVFSVEKVKLNPTLDSGIFEFHVPLGWTLADYRVDPPLIVSSDTLQEDLYQPPEDINSESVPDSDHVHPHPHTDDGRHELQHDTGGDQSIIATNTNSVDLTELAPVEQPADQSKDINVILIISLIATVLLSLVVVSKLRKKQ